MMAHQVVPQIKSRAMSISMMASVTLFPPNLMLELPNQKVLIAMIAVTDNVPPYRFLCKRFVEAACKAASTKRLHKNRYGGQIDTILGEQQVSVFTLCDS